jgi:hypothetical protein
MGAISFIYNITPKSLTLNAQERQKHGLIPEKPRIQTSGATNPELKKITNQVSGFFGNLFKEVKSFGSHAADEIVANLSTPSPAAQTTLVASPPGQLPQSAQSAYPSREGTSANLGSPTTDIAQQEEFELQLALALSLSEGPSQTAAKELEAFLDSQEPEASGPSGHSGRSSPDKSPKQPPSLL